MFKIGNRIPNSESPGIVWWQDLRQQMTQFVASGEKNNPRYKERERVSEAERDCPLELTSQAVLFS